jgi:hypothetical protein
MHTIMLKLTITLLASFSMAQAADTESMLNEFLNEKINTTLTIENSRIDMISMGISSTIRSNVQIDESIKNIISEKRFTINHYCETKKDCLNSLQIALNKELSAANKSATYSISIDNNSTIVTFIAIPK